MICGDQLECKMAAMDDEDFAEEEREDMFISFPPEVQNAIEQVWEWQRRFATYAHYSNVRESCDGTAWLTQQMTE